jgi:hypothetical protein
MVYGLWSMVYGRCLMVNGLWSMVYGLRSMVNGQWSMVNVNGLWAMVNDRWFMVSHFLLTFALMEQLLAQIDQYKKEIRESLAGTKDELEAFRIKYLGTKGLVKTIMGEMKNVAAEQKKEAGQLLNEFKIFVEEKFNELKGGSDNIKETKTAGSNGYPSSYQYCSE